MVNPLKFKMNPKFVRALLTLISAALLFLGPTYALYVLNRFRPPSVLLILIGVGTVVAGVMILSYLETSKKGKERS